MEKTLSEAVVDAIDTLNHFPNPEDSTHPQAMHVVLAAISGVYYTLLEQKKKTDLTSRDIDSMFEHPRIIVKSGNNKEGNKLEIEKANLLLYIKKVEIEQFCNVLLRIFGVEEGTRMFYTHSQHLFQPTLSGKGILSVRKATKKRSDQLLGADLQKLEYLNQYISDGFALLIERIQLLRLPIFDKFEAEIQRIQAVDSIQELERRSELIRATSVLILRNIDDSMRSDAIATLNKTDTILRAQKHSGKQENQDITSIELGEIMKELGSYYGIKIKVKNPRNIIDPRNMEKIIRRYLMKAAYITAPDLIKIAQVQTSILRIKRILRAKEELSRAQIQDMEDVVINYSQGTIQRTFDDAFCQLVKRYKIPK